MPSGTNDTGKTCVSVFERNGRRRSRATDSAQFPRPLRGAMHRPCGPSSYTHTVDRRALALGLLNVLATLAGENTHRGARTSHTTRRRRQGPLTHRRNDVANGLVGVCSGGFSGGAATPCANDADTRGVTAGQAGGDGQPQYGNDGGTRDAAGRRRQNGGTNHRVPAEERPVQEGRRADERA